jgi:hypothetical protein
MDNWHAKISRFPTKQLECYEVIDFKKEKKGLSIKVVNPLCLLRLQKFRSCTLVVALEREAFLNTSVPVSRDNLKLFQPRLKFDSQPKPCGGG